MRRTEAGYYSLVVGVGNDPPSPPCIASLVSQLSRCFRHVLLETAATERSAPWFLECLLRADLAYLFLPGTTEENDHLDHVMSEVRAQRPYNGDCIKLIGCVAEGEQADGFDLLPQSVSRPVHMFVRDCPTLAGGKEAVPRSGPTGIFRADVRRLAREVGGRLVGLALSSGAAKGFAHIGVIQILEENGIEVDVIAGSSMGAYVGSLWAYGLDGTELERLAREMEGRWAVWTLLDPVFPPRQGFLRGLALKKRLMRSIGNARFADLPRPLRIVAGNLATLERMVFTSGEIAAAVHASSAVPGICVPVTIDGETYVDGGTVDPLPVDVLREMGVARVIAVDAIPGPDLIRSGLRARRESAPHHQTGARKLFRKIFPVNQQLNYFACGNLFEILMRSVYGAQIRVAEASCRLADVVLRPDICNDCWLDCRKPGKFIALGREVAERHLDEIKALTARKEATYESELAPEPMATTA
jgi:NTE family protein